MTTETNVERLQRISKTDRYMYDRSGKHVTVNSEDFDWLVQQAERSQALEQEKEFFRRSFVELKAGDVITRKENARLREALEFYADKRNYIFTSEDGRPNQRLKLIDKDSGKTARLALKGESS